MVKAVVLKKAKLDVAARASASHILDVAAATAPTPAMNLSAELSRSASSEWEF